MLQWKIPCVRQWQSEISCAANKTQWNLSKEKRENGIAKGSLEAGQRCKHVTHQFYKAQSLPPGVVISTGSKSLIMTAGSKQKWEKWKRHDPTVLAEYATAKKEMGGGSALVADKRVFILFLTWRDEWHGEGPISDGGVLHRTSVPPDPLSTALCAPSAPTEASTCPLTKAPAGKRGWREWGIHPPLPSPSSPLQAGCSSAPGAGLNPKDSVFPSSHSPRPRGVGPGRPSSPRWFPQTCPPLSKWFLESPWLPSSACLLPEPEQIHTTLSRT